MLYGILAVVMGLNSFSILQNQSISDSISSPYYEYIELVDRAISWEISPVNPQITLFWPGLSSSEERYVFYNGLENRLVVPGDISVIGNKITFNRSVIQTYKTHKVWEDGRDIVSLAENVKYGISIWMSPRLLTRKAPIYKIGFEGMSPESNSRKYGGGFEFGLGVFQASKNTGCVGVVVGVDKIGKRNDTYFAFTPEFEFGPMICGWQSGYIFGNGAPNSLYNSWTVGFHIR